MGVLLQNKGCPCHTELQPALSQKLQLLRGLQPRFSMTPAAMAPYASQWHPMSKRTAAPRDTALTPQCLPQNGAHEESWMKKGTWPLCETRPNKVQSGCSEIIGAWRSHPSKPAKFRRDIAKPLDYVTFSPRKDLCCSYSCCPAAFTSVMGFSELRISGSSWRRSILTRSPGSLKHSQVWEALT